MNVPHICYAQGHVRYTQCPRIGHHTDNAFDPRFASHGNSTHCAQTYFGFPFLCGQVTDRTLYPLIPQGMFLRIVSTQHPQNLQKISEKDLLNVPAVDLAVTVR